MGIFFPVTSLSSLGYIFVLLSCVVANPSQPLHGTVHINTSWFGQQPCQALLLSHPSSSCETPAGLQVSHEHLFDDEIQGQASPITITSAHHMETFSKMLIHVWMLIVEIRHSLQIYPWRFCVVVVSTCGQVRKHF